VKQILILFIISSYACIGFTQPFMVQPIEGIQGKDYIIVNYVDWRQTGIMDAYCGTKTYDGHQGTDYSLRSFKQMDSVVNILAAADGVVTFIKDGLFDRETEGKVSKGLGNYIAIRHPNKYYSYYGHLMRESLAVKVGDTVKQGEIIAAVGSSGNSTDAHLHFEVWYDSLYVVDPFNGSCGNANTVFLNSSEYDTSLHIWDYGMQNSLVDLNALRERVETISSPYVFQPTATTPVLFWSHLSGLKKNDELTIKWISPSQTVWFQYSVTFDQDWWYYYYFSYINNTNLAKGSWKAILELNGKPIVTQPFLVDDNAAVPQINLLPKTCNVANIKQLLRRKDLFMCKLTSINGQTITINNDAFEMQLIIPGVYFLEAEFENEKRCYQKIIVD
jgi:murein DD-endopeptidase MepM/ murein hydrolase activator NlpD